MSEDALTFDLNRRAISVFIKNEQGVTQEFKLVELTGTDRDAHMNALSKRMTLSVDGKTQRIKDYEGLQASLIARSLQDMDGNLVSQKVIQTWPSHVLNVLFEKVQEMSGLAKGAEDDAKND